MTRRGRASDEDLSNFGILKRIRTEAEEEDLVPVVLDVQLRRTLHELVSSASEDQLLEALHRVVKTRVMPLAENQMETLQNQMFVLLRQTFGSGVDFPTNVRHHLQIQFRDSILQSIDSILLVELRKAIGGGDKQVGELKDMAHSAVRRFNRRDRILLGRELQMLGVQEIVFEAPLPLLAWFNILSFMELKELLGSVCRVNRAWFRACTHDKLWNSFALVQLISMGNRPMCPNPSDIPQFFKKLKNIIDIKFDSLSGNDFILEHVAQNCLFIKKLEIPECHVVTDRGVGFIAKSERLQVLNMESCEQITNLGIEMIAASCSDLQELNLKYCRNVDDVGIAFLASGCRLLKKLNLNYLPITDAAMENLAQGCPQLVDLSLKYCRNVTDAGIVMLSKSCHDLKILTLSYCHQITDIALQHLGLGCFQLEDLNVKYCREITDKGLENLAKGCLKLVDLSINYCENISDEGLIALANGCQQLKALKIVYCRKVTDRGINAIAASCRQLVALLADSCPLLTDVSLQSISNGCHLLNRLNLDSCLRLTDAGLASLSKGCKELTKINLNACELITDAGISSLISESSSKLKQIILTNCPRVSKSFLKQVTSLGIKIQ